MIGDPADKELEDAADELREVACAFYELEQGVIRQDAYFGSASELQEAARRYGKAWHESERAARPKVLK